MNFTLQMVVTLLLQSTASKWCEVFIIAAEVYTYLELTSTSSWLMARSSGGQKE